MSDIGHNDEDIVSIYEKGECCGRLKLIVEEEVSFVVSETKILEIVGKLEEQGLGGAYFNQHRDFLIHNLYGDDKLSHVVFL